MHIRGIFISDRKGRGNSSIYQYILLLILQICLVQCNVSPKFRGKSGIFAFVILSITSLQSSYMYFTKKSKIFLLGRYIVEREWKIFKYGEDLAAEWDYKMEE